MTVEYPKEQVLKAARTAYRNSLSGSNDDYVENKANLFVQRCLKYDHDPDSDVISQDAVKEIAFAALDPYCTAQLYASLDAYYHSQEEGE